MLDGFCPNYDERVLECVPIKKHSENMFDMMGFQACRNRLINHGERYFESIDEEKMRWEEYDRKVALEDKNKYLRCGRMFSHITNSTCFGTITAFRDEYSLQQNHERNKELEGQLRRLRFGFNKIEGFFVDNDGQNPVVEEIFIVFSTHIRKDELKNFLRSACRHYDQDATIFVADGKVSSWHKNGEEKEMDAFQLNPKGFRQAYSSLKGKPFHFGYPYFAKQNAFFSVQMERFVMDSEPIKTDFASKSDYLSYQEARQRLIKYGEQYFEHLDVVNAAD